MSNEPSHVIYLDHNATTPLDEAVLAAMLPLLREQFGNPASGHVLGRAARDAVQRSRNSVARLLGAGSGRIVFTASATEANNLAIFGLTSGASVPRHHDGHRAQVRGRTGAASRSRPAASASPGSGPIRWAKSIPMRSRPPGRPTPGWFRSRPPTA